MRLRGSILPDRIVFVSRTGYTGEDGFEIVAEAGIIEALWDQVLEKGKAAGLKPAGLGARDTLADGGLLSALRA